MNFSCTKDNLQRGLGIVSHISNKQVNLPVLQNVHIRAEGGSIVLSTTNLELAVRVSIRGKVDSGGESTVPAKLFSDYVSLLPSDRVDIEGVDAMLHVACGDTSTSMNGIDASEFPLIPKIESSSVFVVQVELLREAVSQVLFSVASNEARPELSGVLMNFSGNELYMAATDSYRLSERIMGLVSTTGDRRVIVPARALQEVGRMLSTLKDVPGVEPQVTIEISDNQAVFKFGPAELTTRTIEGNYPDYTQIIPTVFQTELVVGRKELVNAVKTASLFSRSGIFDVVLEVDPENKRLTVNASEATRGRNTASCEADVQGKKNTMTVNFRYLLDGLNAMSSEGVTMRMIDAMNPCVISPNGQANTGKFTYIVMPIRQ